MAWNYERTESSYEPIPEGRHRIRISSAEKAISASGNDMLALQFDVSGYGSILYHYIVFLNNRPEITNRNLTRFFDSFADIEDGDFNMNNWIGKVGACVVVHEKDNNGETRARIKYFIDAKKQADLPPWRDANGYSTADISSENLPF